MIFTSLFEIDTWNFWYFNLMSKPLAFGTIHFKYMLLFLFPSQILVCVMTFSAHYLFSRFDIGWAFKQKKLSVKRYRHKSTLVSRLTKLLTNHSRQVWRSIYNNYIEVKISPIMIWVHREQVMLINEQSHKYKGTRQNMLMTKHNNIDQTFWIFYFLCVIRFLTQKQEKIDQKQQCKNI